MSRRQDREGVSRSELQRRRNLACEPERHTNERGWYVPHLVWEGWEEFNRACYALRRHMILRHLSSPVERGYALHDTRVALARSKTCASPALL